MGGPNMPPKNQLISILELEGYPAPQQIYELLIEDLLSEKLLHNHMFKQQILG